MKPSKVEIRSQTTAVPKSVSTGPRVEASMSARSMISF